MSYNPETDPDIYAHYSVNDMAGKAVNKAELQKRLGLEEDPEVPLIGMVTRMVAHKGLDLVKETLDQLMWETNIQFVILGSGDYEYETFFREMQNKYPGRLCACFGFVPELSRKIYAGADIFLMPSKSEPCGLSQMRRRRGQRLHVPELQRRGHADVCAPRAGGLCQAGRLEDPCGARHEERQFLGPLRQRIYPHVPRTAQGVIRGRTGPDERKNRGLRTVRRPRFFCFVRDSSR